MTSMPEVIPFNIIDRSYLISETEEDDSLYFPMSPITVVKLKSAFSVEAITQALQSLATNYPQLRLGYRLDYANIRWVRIADDELNQHLADCVQVLDITSSIEALISDALCVNNQSLSQPINVLLADDYLMIRMHHSFGDGKFMFLLFQYLLAELQENEVDKTPLSEHWWLPLWKLIWQDMSRGRQVMWQFTKSLFGFYQDYQKDTAPLQSATERQPVVSGSPMSIMFRSVDAASLAMLKEMQTEISLNTLLQVVISHRLHELGLIGHPTTYTIPVDLRRYLKGSTVYYPSNLASQIRVTMNTEQSFAEQCQQLQTEIREQLQRASALVSIPGEWLLALSGSKTYQSVNRDWLLKSTHTDPRFFIFSNLGTIDTLFTPVDSLLADDFGPRIFIPLMGGPPFVLSFSIHKGQGNIAVTYDSQILSEEQVQDALDCFDLAYLQSLGEAFRD